MLPRDFRAAIVAAAMIIIAGCSSGSHTVAAFDGNRAYGLLKKQCDFGPRYSGTPGHKATAAFLEAELKKTADEVSTQSFKKQISGKELEFKNIFGVINPKAERFVLLCAHWDSRPTADEEINPEKMKQPIMGANDGASGVAVLLELAQQFHGKKPQIGVVIALFDGEDYGPGPKQMFLGSAEFARTWKSAVKPGGREISYDYGILLDMIGDSDLQIYRERISNQLVPAIVDKVWMAAADMGKGDAFLNETRYTINDDHVPLLRAGIKCIDIIDFDYASWHTLEDTTDKCSTKSLQTVGDVISKVIYEEKPNTK